MHQSALPVFRFPAYGRADRSLERNTLKRFVGRRIDFNGGLQNRPGTLKNQPVAPRIRHSRLHNSVIHQDMQHIPDFKPGDVDLYDFVIGIVNILGHGRRVDHGATLIFHIDGDDRAVRLDDLHQRNSAILGAPLVGNGVVARQGQMRTSCLLGQNLGVIFLPLYISAICAIGRSQKTTNQDFLGIWITFAVNVSAAFNNESFV